MEYTDVLVGFLTIFLMSNCLLCHLLIYLGLPTFVNYLATRKIPPHWSKQEKDRSFSQVRHYYWKDTYLFNHYPTQVVRRCVNKIQIYSILTFLSLLCLWW